jgi:glycosyltransferase involved in cell wall biosynthesis
MARAARDAGFEVHVATRVERHGAAIAAEGFHLHPVAWRRGSLDPRGLARTVRAVRKVYRDSKPDLAHHVSLEAAVVGSLAALGLPVRCLNALTGLGTVFVTGTVKARMTRPAWRVLLRTLLNRKTSHILVQNPDDRAAVGGLGIDPARVALIPGSGVDIDALRPSPEPPEPITAVFAGRLVADKGIRTLIAAHDMLRERGRAVRLVIAGLPDPANATSISADEIAAWARKPDLVHLGYAADMAAVWASAHIAVLPSRREGLPLSLLEAAACGRPLVATDVPGCREIARAGVNALLVPPDDPSALAGAIDRLARDPELRRRFGRASRELAEREFSSARIGRDIVALYRRLLDRSAS